MRRSGFSGALIIAGVITGTMILASCEPTPTDRAADARWLTQHANDPPSLDDKFGSEAQSACSVRADDYLRTIASNDFGWDDDAKGFAHERFDHIIIGSAGPYLLTLVSNKAKLSNAFGAFQHIALYCTYDVRGSGDPAFSLDAPVAKAFLDKQAAQAVPQTNDAENVAADSSPQSFPQVPQNDEARADQPPEDEVHRQARAVGWCDGGTNSSTGEINWIPC